MKQLYMQYISVFDCPFRAMELLFHFQIKLFQVAELRLLLGQGCLQKGMTPHHRRKRWKMITELNTFMDIFMLLEKPGSKQQLNIA